MFAGRFTQALPWAIILRTVGSTELMNTKDLLRLGVPPGEATRRATDFVTKFILGGSAFGSAEFIPL